MENHSCFGKILRSLLSTLHHLSAVLWEVKTQNRVWEQQLSNNLEILKAFLIAYWQRVTWSMLLEHCINTSRLVSLKFWYCIINIKDCEVVTITSTCIKTLDGKLGLRVQGIENDWWWNTIGSAQHEHRVEDRARLQTFRTVLLIIHLHGKKCVYACHP